MKSVEEKADIKKRKKLDKEKKRQIEQANKMLIPVNKKTRLSLGILSFDPEGTLRLTDNRWLKVFEADGDVSNLIKIVDQLSGRIRITMHLRTGCGRETCHISLMHIGDIYEQVREKMKVDEELLRRVLSLTRLSINQVMSQVGEQYFKSKEFSYASSVRSKKDWKQECLGEIEEQDQVFRLLDLYGESFVILSYPSIVIGSVAEQLKMLGCECYLSCDLQVMEAGDKDIFNRTMEKRYNRHIIKLSDEQHLNTSMSIVVLCDSDDARQIIEQMLVAMCANRDVLLATSFGRQKKTADSILTLGIFEERTMRNVNEKVIRGMLGGNSYENPQI